MPRSQEPPLPIRCRNYKPCGALSFATRVVILEYGHTGEDRIPLGNDPVRMSQWRIYGGRGYDKYQNSGTVFVEKRMIPMESRIFDHL